MSGLCHPRATSPDIPVNILVAHVDGVAVANASSVHDRLLHVLGQFGFVFDQLLELFDRAVADNEMSKAQPPNSFTKTNRAAATPSQCCATCCVTMRDISVLKFCR